MVGWGGMGGWGEWEGGERGEDGERERWGGDKYNMNTTAWFSDTNLWSENFCRCFD